MNNICGIILEGYSHTGKTSILKALKQVQAKHNNERSVIVLSEHYTQVLHRTSGGLRKLTQAEHLRLLKERVSMLQSFNTWAKKTGQPEKNSNKLFFILERFHLNHRVSFSDSLTEEISSLENDLLTINAKCVLLTVSADIGERIMSRNKSEWVGDKKKDLKLESERLLEQQEEYRIQAERSSVPTIELNTDGKEWLSHAEQMYNLILNQKT
ncbi:hypothetical protein MM326_03540 [Alkalihalobacillus sp. LMS6]|uniref:hypothetical protein n=1 Tax=Alkalihalobacillus sp. LMS6 TaxID=2924034 RepID=UPI0020D04FC2|nr:hypothetical protein [Alkalihalobacillus sp. LMS6]UTR07120.1 hypothetical protein MM326_03540 [Alkalihalobacillus sp. LMS6]